MAPHLYRPFSQLYRNVIKPNFLGSNIGANKTNGIFLMSSSPASVLRWVFICSKKASYLSRWFKLPIVCSTKCPFSPFFWEPWSYIMMWFSWTLNYVNQYLNHELAMQRHIVRGKLMSTHLSPKLAVIYLFASLYSEKFHFTMCHYVPLM